MRFAIHPTLWIVLSACACAQDGAFFRSQVAPILEQHCVGCHSGEEPKGGLDLSTAGGAFADGDSGTSIEPGKPDNSLLIEYVSGEEPEMPQNADPLTAEQVDALRRWIAAGAVWPDDLTLTDKKTIDADWWSLGPLAETNPPAIDDPWIRTPVDAFVVAQQREHGLSPSGEADRRTLIRRLTFNLHGLPPTPEDVKAFVGDRRPDAYERLVERLLASPRYGERWGRHWLDVVHFGESHGYDKDKPRPNAWPYRDWVVQSFNQDKPYDRFVAEQVAGDVLWPLDPQAIVATGFIAAGPWDFVGHAELAEGTVNKDIARSNDRDDMVATAASTFLSLTVHCARCHDHKFDPIRQQDYYALQAVFAGIDRADRPYDVDRETARRRRQLTTEKSEIEERLKSLATADSDHDEVAQLKNRLARLDAELAALPAQRMVYAAAVSFKPIGTFTPPAGPRPIHLLLRGDVRNHGQLMAPGGVACVHGAESDFGLEQTPDEGQRRAALARWLVDPRNALLRRSIVNRIWHYHFGAGLVASPNDFGRMGARPSHPELLEWLAGWFAERGHSLKELHRLLLNSAVYRQHSRSRADYAQIDSQNRYLWRMNRTRLDAECVRDALLAVSGKLDVTMGGPSAQQFFFKDDHSPIYDYTRFDVDDPRGARRSVYRFLVRSVPDPLMECLDCADPSIMTPKRNTTLTALQALALLNNPLAVRQAAHLADRLERECDNLPARIDAAYRLALSREPRDPERELLVRHAERHGLAAACRVILNCNEFVFVD